MKINSLIIIFSGILILLSSHADAQRVIVNGNGERIIMFPDGSWRLAEAGDSVLINQNLSKSETAGRNNEFIDQVRQRTKAEEEEYAFRQWNELHFKIKSLEKKIQNEFRSATNAHFSAAELYYNAEANKSMIEPDRLAVITENYEQSIRDLKRAKQNQTAIKKLFEQSKKLASIQPEKMAGKVAKLNSRFKVFMTGYDPQYIIKKEEPLKNKLKGREKIDDNANKKETDRIRKEISAPTSSSAPAAVGGMPAHLQPKPYVSEPFHCDVKIDILDESTGRKRVELEPGLIFTHTDPDLRPFFKKRELITCNGQLSRIDAYVYLIIEFKIASSHAQSNFGSLQDGSLLRLRLLNNENVSLYNLRTDQGRIDPYSGDTVFIGQYSLGKDEIKMLLSSELDKVRILWSTGYEDYDVYNVDFFIDRLNCLMNR